MQMKTNFHMKRWAPGPTLKKRPEIIRKWPICVWSSPFFFLMRAFQPVTPLDKLFKDKDIEFPSNKVIKRLTKFLSLCREGQLFFESHCDRVKVPLDLNSAYYVFDVSGQQWIQNALNPMTLLISGGARGQEPSRRTCGGRGTGDGRRTTRMGGKWERNNN